MWSLWHEFGVLPQGGSMRPLGFKHAILMHDQGGKNAVVPRCRDIHRYIVAFTFGSPAVLGGICWLALHGYRGAVMVFKHLANANSKTWHIYNSIVMALYKTVYQFKESEAKHTFNRLKCLILLSHSEVFFQRHNIQTIQIITKNFAY